MKNRVTKYFTTFLTFLICVMNINGDIRLKAITYNLTEEFHSDWQHAGTTAYGDATKMWVNGDLVWCLQPDNRTLVGNQSVIDISDIGITQNKMDKIALIVYYGYRAKTHNDTNYFLTQNMIWKFLGSPGRLVSGTYPNDSSWENIYNEVLDKTNSFGDTPSFHGKTFTMDIGKTLSIEDTNKVLNDLLIKKVTGGTATILGNTLKITPDGSSKNMTIIFNRNITKEQTNANFIVRANGKDSYGRKYQGVSPCLSGSDPYFSNVKINVNLYGSIKLTKKDEAGKNIPNTSFKLSENANMSSPLGTYKTGTDGTVTIDELVPGTYYVQEIAVPSPLIVDKTIHKLVVSANKTSSFTATNKWVLGSISITKEDNVTGNQSQGEATLKGAVYGLYARKNILHPSTNAIVYAKNTEVKRLTTDANASASVSNLYLGDYYVKEITPSHGYTLDSTEYDISLTYENQSTKVVTKQQTLKERVIAQSFSLIKISDNGSGEADQLAGVEFTIKAQKDIEKAGSWEKAPIAKNAQNKTAAIVITDNKGYAQSDELPFGTYIVRETKVPDEHYKVPDFKVVIDKDSRDPQPWRVFNDVKFRAVVAIIKQDAETMETIKLSGAKFRIKNLDKNEYVGGWVWNPVPHYVDSWTTDETGTVMTDNVLDPGNYQLEEVQAPLGYILNSTPIKFKVGMNVAYETLPDGTTPLISVVIKDTSVKGKIKLSKEGEVLIDVKQENGKTEFVYEKRKLANAKFGIYAKENIYSADQQKTILYEKDELIEELISKEDKECSSKLLPLGKYYVKEIEAPQGYVVSEEIYDVELMYKDQESTVVVHDIGSILNERQKVKVEAHKYDEHTKQTVQGAEISLFANRDVYNAEGKVLIQSGTYLDKVITDENGQGEFTIDLPLDLTPDYAIMPIEEGNEQPEKNENSLFYVVETKAPDGYNKGEEIRHFIDTMISTEDIVYDFKNSFYNQQTEILVAKLDKGGLPVVGAELEVLDEQGKIVKHWTSNGEDYKIEGLVLDKTYTLHEAKPAEGYASAKDIEFIVKETKERQRIIMIDEEIQVSFLKIDKASRKPLKGNVLAVYDQHDQLIEQWTSEDMKHTIKKLTANETYILREEQACSGYTQAKDMKFVVKDTEAEQLIVMENERKPIIKKKREDIKTGDTTQRNTITSLFLLSVLTIFVLRKKRE